MPGEQSGIAQAIRKERNKVDEANCEQLAHGSSFILLVRNELRGGERYCRVVVASAHCDLVVET